MRDINALATEIANAVYKADNDGEIYYSDEDVMDFEFNGHPFTVFVFEGSPIGSGYFALQEDEGEWDEEWDDGAPYYTFSNKREILSALEFIQSNGFAAYDW